MIAELLAARGLPAPRGLFGGGIPRVIVPDAAARWAGLRDLPGFWPVLDGGGLHPPDAAEVRRALALGRAFDAGSWLRRRKTVYEPHELPAEGAPPPTEPSPAPAILLCPTDLPWAAPAMLGLGGDAAPDPEHHVAVHRRWHELFGAELAWAGQGSLELWVERPPVDLLEAKVLAREQLAYCAGILAEPAIAGAARAGLHPLEAIAAARVGVRLWRFAW